MTSPPVDVSVLDLVKDFDTSRINEVHAPLGKRTPDKAGQKAEGDGCRAVAAVAVFLLLCFVFLLRMLLVFF